jgi:DNA-directed RNA polymerase subunit RPC12/RpoP
LACPKCGCRIVTKVGRGKAMLICADCGHPVDERQGEARLLQRGIAALIMAMIVGLGGMILFLSASNDSPLDEAPPPAAEAGE